MYVPKFVIEFLCFMLLKFYVQSRAKSFLWPTILIYTYEHIHTYEHIYTYENGIFSVGRDFSSRNHGLVPQWVKGLGLGRLKSMINVEIGTKFELRDLIEIIIQCLCNLNFDWLIAYRQFSMSCHLQRH